MEIPNQNEIEGGLEQASGEVKEGIGRITGDEQLANEGTGARIAGKIQEGYGSIEREVEDFTAEIEDHLPGN